MKCHQCGYGLPTGAKFCRSCGVSQIQIPVEQATTTDSVESLQAVSPKCIKCGNEIQADAKFCRSCGASQVQTPTAPPIVVEPAVVKVVETPTPVVVEIGPIKAPPPPPIVEHQALPLNTTSAKAPSTQPRTTAPKSKPALYAAIGAFIVVAAGGLGYWGWMQQKTGYDFKTLGFSSKVDMEAAFSKGYHTKQKLDEMIKPPVAAVVATPVPVQPAPVSEPAPSQVAVAQQAAPQSQTPTAVVIPPACDSVKACADAMLAAAKGEALPSAMDSALRIDAMPKPQRGDRKMARKLNAEGLEALKQRKLAEAAATLTKALEADRADEEIISNLIYTYSEDGNFTKAEQLAYDGLLLNPRRANIWLPIAIAKQKQNKPNEALQAMWLAWQFSGDKQRMLNLLDKRIAEETDGSLKAMYVNARAWSVDGKKPSF